MKLRFKYGQIEIGKSSKHTAATSMSTAFEVTRLSARPSAWRERWRLDWNDNSIEWIQSEP